MKKNIIRLTESELKNMIVESVKKILSEGMNDTSSNTHYAIHKPTGKIVFSWDYTGYDPEDLKLYKKDYFTVDLLDMGMNPKEITVITRKSCEKRGIDPTDDANWSNYPMAESLKKKKEYLKEFNNILQPPVQEDIIEVDLMYLEFSNPQLEEFFEDAKCPEAVSVRVEYTVEPINRGDYWTPPSGGEVEIENMEVDYDGVFKNIIPADLYQSFVSEVQSYVNDNWDRYSENYEEYEPDYYED